MHNYLYTFALIQLSWSAHSQYLSPLFHVASKDKVAQVYIMFPCMTVTVKYTTGRMSSWVYGASLRAALAYSPLARMRSEGYGSWSVCCVCICLCLSVCLSVTTLAAA